MGQMLLFKLGRTFVSFAPALTCLYCAFKINDENAETHLINRFSSVTANKGIRKIHAKFILLWSLKLCVSDGFSLNTRMCELV